MGISTFKVIYTLDFFLPNFTDVFYLQIINLHKILKEWKNF